MGHSKSKIVQEIVNKTFNSTSNSSLTSQSQETSVETLVESAKSCSSSVNMSNSCEVGNVKIANGGFNYGGKQSNKASVNFSCIQSDKAAQAMESSAVSSLAAEIQSLNGTEAAAVLNAAAAASSKTGSLAAGGNADADISSKNSNQITNVTQNTIENIMKSHISQNLTSKTVDECIGKTVQSNEQKIGNVTVGEGNVNIECNQSNSLESVQECAQFSEAIQTSLGKTAQELGFKVETVNKTGNKTEMKSKASSESIATGPIQDLGNAISGMLGLASLGLAAPYIAICCCVCCCILLSCAGSLMISKSGGSSSGSSDNFHASRGRRGRRGGMRGGYSSTESSDVIGYLGLLSASIISDVVSDSSPLFD
jgi:hypothetical protein